jgi:hypothetical protein
MVARITFPSSLQKALNYNEQKVQQGKAECISGNGFLMPVYTLNFYNKLDIYECRNALNDRAVSKSIHVSLNFSPQEHLSYDQLAAIAGDYMERIGFGAQPYFVYHHTDAGHPHIHILASTIGADGKRINTHNIGRNQSEIARRLIEEKYGLIKAGKNQPKQGTQIIPVKPEKVQYGRSETRRGIANVVEAVVRTYNFTSLPELNAALKQFNVLGDRGDEESFVYRKNGLLYRILDENGNAIGVPIKASLLPGNPGLANLQKRFEENFKNREQPRHKLKEIIDNEIAKSPSTISELTANLKQYGISIVTRVNADGILYGITFVDTVNRSVFNGSQIGKAYSVAGLLKQLNGTEYGRHNGYQREAGKGFVEFNGVSAVAALMTPEEESSMTPWQWKKKRKRKIRR